MSSLTLSNHLTLHHPTVPSLWYHPSLCPTILHFISRQSLLFDVTPHSVQPSYTSSADSPFSLVSPLTLSNHLTLHQPTVPSLWYHPSLCPTILHFISRQSLLFDSILHFVQPSYTSSADCPFSLISPFTLSNHLTLHQPTVPSL